MSQIPQDMLRSTGYGKLKDFLDREWPTIRVTGVIIALLTLWATARSTGSTARQTDLLATQVADELSQPVLEGRGLYKSGSREGLELIQGEMIDELFDTVFEMSKNNLDAPYHQHLAKLPPITRNIPPVPVIVSASVENTGNDVATGVSISVEWEGEITDVIVRALSQWKIAGGGTGGRSVLVSIERISAEETVEVSIEYAPTKDAIDKVELSIDHPDTAFALSSPLPTFALIPGEFTPSYDLLLVRVSSNETPLQVLSLQPGDSFSSVFEEFFENNSRP